MLAQRLRLARTTHDKDLAAFSRLIGIRVDHVRAIEDGRFSDLPAGIYGRAAVKAYAGACGLDPAAVLADAEAWLVSMDDPIIGIARLKGLRVPTPPPPVEGAPPVAPPADVAAALATWRPLAASLIDAGIISALLGIVVLSAVAALFVPVRNWIQNAIDKRRIVVGLGTKGVAGQIRDRWRFERDLVVAGDLLGPLSGESDVHEVPARERLLVLHRHEVPRGYQRRFSNKNSSTCSAARCWTGVMSRPSSATMSDRREMPCWSTSQTRSRVPTAC